MKLSKLLDETKAYNVQNNINGNYIATIGKGENQLDRLKNSLQEEFSSETVEISNVDEVAGNGITFDINLDEGGFQSIQLLSAFIY